MMVLGLDVNSARTGFAYGDSRNDTVPITGVWKLPGGEDIAQACADLATNIECLCNSILPEIVAVEEPITLKDRSAHTDLVLKSLFGAAVGAAKKRRCHVYAVAPQTWRQQFTGRGVHAKGKAKAAVLTVCKYLKWPVQNHDEADAAGVWDWACHNHARTLFVKASA